MCGIFGLTGGYSTTVDDDNFLKHCMLAGTVRGVDGTGIIFVDREDKVSYHKKAMNGATFLQEYFNPALHMGNKTHSVICHNRAATMGSINDETAHPFVESGVIGVHNGTLRGDWNSMLEVSHKLDVDSQGLYRAIGSRGIDWAVSKLHGAAALVWCDIKSQRIFVYRNAERPLHYATSTGAIDKVYYASEAGMLSWLLEKNRIKASDPIPFKQDTLYEITGGEVEEMRHIPRYQPPVPKGNNYGSQHKGPALLPKPNTLTNIGKNIGTGTINRVVKRFGGVDYPLTQSGVPFRAYAVSQEERDNGIIGEFAERNFTYYPCFCCNKTIYDADFYESVIDDEIKIHHKCFDEYRINHDPHGKLRNIKRDPKLATVLTA